MFGRQLCQSGGEDGAVDGNADGIVADKGTHQGPQSGLRTLARPPLRNLELLRHPQLGDMCLRFVTCDLEQHFARE